MSQVIVFVYSNGKKFEGPQGLTFEGQKRAIQIKRGISYDMLMEMIGAKLKLESHQIISSLTYRFPTSQSTYTDLEIFDSEDVECMIIAAEKHSHVNFLLELYVEIGVVGDRSSQDEDGGGVPNDESSDNTEAAGGEDSRSSPPSSPIQQPRSWTYHVCVNFRGIDTRRGFTDHLYASLERKGIITYRVSKNLGGGEMRSNELLKAIEKSMIAITVFSPNYASSTWCLDELQKIVECMRNRELLFVPVFYNVEPSDVRHQKGHFFEAFHRHELTYKPEQVSSWRDTLREVAMYSGFYYRDQPEANFVDSIVQHIHKRVMYSLPSCTKNLASRVEELIRLRDIELKGVRFAYMGHNGHLFLPTKTFNSPSSNYANNIGLSNDDKDRSSKDVDGGGVPNDESSDNTEVTGDFNANSNVESASSIVAASPRASSFRDIPLQAGEDSCSSPPSSSIQQPRSWTYHVFLNFRGADTRRGFTGHLYASLERKGIITYWDDKNLGGGEKISVELIKAIEESMIAITIFSPNYASSTWCLDELQKIVDCNDHMGLFVVPVFYDVEPADVRHQKGSFEEAFHKHESRCGGDNKKVSSWRDALRKVADYSGFDSRDQLEANFIDRITEYIHEQVMRKLPFCTENLASRVEEVIRLIDIGLKDVRFAYMGHGACKEC